MTPMDYIRHTLSVLDMPVFSTVTNREAVVFDAAAPITGA